MSYVYLAQTIIQDVYKIGESESPIERLHGINKDYLNLEKHKILLPVVSVAYTLQSHNAKSIESRIQQLNKKSCLFQTEYFYFRDIDRVKSQFERHYQRDNRRLPSLRSRFTSGVQVSDLPPVPNNRPIITRESNRPISVHRFYELLPVHAYTLFFWQYRDSFGYPEGLSEYAIERIERYKQKRYYDYPRFICRKENRQLKIYVDIE